jgi:hypothetical protein
MIVFPFGFYILEGKRPVYVGNDLEAQKTVRSWMGANPEKVRLSFDQIGSAHIATKFLGWNAARSNSMDRTPLLFEGALIADEQTHVRRFYGDYDAALEGHVKLIEIAKGRLH